MALFGKHRLKKIEHYDMFMIFESISTNKLQKDRPL